MNRQSRTTSAHAPANDRARPFGATRAQAGVWWATRTPRERRLLGIGATVVTLGLAWSIALQPAIDSIRRSLEQLPRLRAEAVQVDALILDALALQRSQPGEIEPSALSDALADDLRRAGLEASSTQVKSAPGSAEFARAWEVVMEDAGASAVMDWLAGLPYRLHVTVDSVEFTRSRIDGRDRPGHVSGRIVLRQATEAIP